MPVEEFKGLPQEFEITVINKQVGGGDLYNSGKAHITLESKFGEGWVDRTEPRYIRQVEHNGTATINLVFNSYAEADKISFGQKFRVSITPVEEISELQAELDALCDDEGEEDGTTSCPSEFAEIIELKSIITASLGENTRAINLLIKTLKDSFK
jgi:hypothetical protein